MKVLFSVTGSEKPYPSRLVENMDAIPREGETVELPDLPTHLTHVRTVVWYPIGDEDEVGPFVYIVLGPSRP
jgi:hypothetical protein